MSCLMLEQLRFFKTLGRSSTCPPIGLIGTSAPLVYRPNTMLAWPERTGLLFYSRMLYFRRRRADGGPEGRRMTNTRKILIVDDGSELREALVEQLWLHEEFESIAVDNGTKGVQTAKAGQIDLVIMD